MYDKTLMQQIATEMAKKAYETFRESLIGASPPITSTCANTDGENLTVGRIKESLNEVLKYQVKFKRMPYLEKYQVIILDYEKIRNDMPFKQLLDDKQRGKAVLFNPADEPFLRRNFPSQYFE
jgi:hypothetical protein